MTTQWSLPDSEACETELAKRLIVRIGSQETEMGSQPTLDVGCMGSYKERVITEKLSLSLVKVVGKILGMKEP